MIRGIIEASLLEDAPLSKLSREYKWNIYFSEDDISDLQKYVKLMGPLETLFTALNAENKPTIHLVYPTLQVFIFP